MSRVHGASVKLNNMTWHTKTEHVFLQLHVEMEQKIKEKEQEGKGACLLAKKKKRFKRSFLFDIEFK